MKSGKTSKAAPKPIQVGDYFVCKYGTGHYVHLKIGPHWTDDVHVATAATAYGAEKLAALMNAARDLAICHRDIATSSPYKSQSPRDWAASCIASAVCEALDTPFPYADPREEMRNSILYFDHDNRLAELFEVLDATGDQTSLGDQAARFALLKHSACGRRHYTEVIRAWRDAGDKLTSAADRAAKAIARAKAGNREVAA